MSANWFIALPVDAGDWFASLVSPPPAGLTRFHPDDLHLTVAFLGPVAEDAARAAWEALAWPLGPVRVTLGAVAPMGPPGRYSALSALLDQGREPVERAMGASRDAACDAAGAARERRPPKAHLTLARPGRTASEAVRQAGLAWAAGLALGEVSLTLDRVALYTWSDDRRASRFRVVAERAASGATGGAGS